MRILISIPSRGRPDECKAAIDRFANAIEVHSLARLAVILDGDDPRLLDYTDVVGWMYGMFGEALVCHVTEASNKVKAINMGATIPVEWDALVVASDDLWPQKGFDQAIRTDFANEADDFDAMLWGKDQNHKVCCHPVIGRKYYERDGYVGFPQYRSVYCDDEWTAVADKRKKLYRTTSFAWEHRHPNYGLRKADELDARNRQWMMQDYRLFVRRQAQGFPPQKAIQ